MKLGMQTYGWYTYGNNFGLHFSIEMVLYEVKCAGYKYVDLSGYTLREIGKQTKAKKLFDRYGLKLVSMSCPVGDRRKEGLKKTKEQMKFLKEMGAEATMVCGWSQEKGESYKSAFRRLCDQCDEIHEFGKRIGLKPGYHNHMEQGVETEEQIINFLESTKIGFCPDVGHMAGAGVRPLKLIKQFDSRIVHGHLKDIIIDKSKNLVRFCEIGKGNARIPFKKIFQYLDSVGFDGYFTVEQDKWTVSPLVDAMTSRGFLESGGIL